MLKRFKFAWQAFRLKEGEMIFVAYTDDILPYECDEEGCHEDAILCVSGVYYEIKKHHNDHYHACGKHAIERLRALGCNDMARSNEGERIRSIK